MNSFRVPMFGYSLLVFLALGVIVAIACMIVFRSGDQGKTKLSAPAGCAIGCGLLGFALLGAFGFLALCALDWRAQAVRRGPFKSFEFHWDTDHGLTRRDESTDSGESLDTEDQTPESSHEADAGYRARLIVELRGSRDEVATTVGQISRWLRENTDGEFSISSTNTDTSDGSTTRVEWGLPVQGEDLRKLKNDLQEQLGGFEIPKGVDVKIEVKDPEED